ncbi:type IX secretion system outer membrane channel protein PorV [Xanthocytophaga agilis]|uniref:Type IX secretion system outer membrane channel protein PorV n=1 Tax=Xanthocytophaga agilis TaxID=3048010 RepID=A0AAE3UJJ5_9BACT|nr:type IX secretion system outer membrane channel protein PorV [Xanthocytophaga agilis]MDJ1506926.1 type IX secretion system outer membrane channel protein PorV [Xanthocytophaga agilis]
MMQNYSKRFLLAALTACIVGVSEVKSQTNPVTSAVPFLLISPDARAAGMGDVGVATSPDVNATYWNPAKLVFAEKKVGAALSYTPWFRSLPGVNDMWLGYLTGYYQVNKNQAIGIGLQYSNLGNISFTDINGVGIRDFSPREFALAPSFAQKFSKNFSGSITLRLIYSNLSGNIDLSGGAQGKAGVTVGGDIALFYNKDLNISGKDFHWAWGVNLSNLGPKISYSTNNEREFIATNLKFGTALTYNIDPYNKFTLAADINKLMVPTAKGGANARPTGPLISGIFGSFTDAPGGFSEELKEYIWSVGAEYWYNNIFAARAGYFHESKEKGYRQYYTFGLGVRYTVMGLDFAYLAPAQGSQSPLAETMRFTLHFNIGERPADDEEGK